MSDHRFSLDVTFSIYGKTFEWHPWLNWVPDDDYGIDQRIIEWFSERYHEARATWDHEMANHEAAEQERFERAELARLQDKYPT